MIKKPVVSVIIPTYNRAHLVKRAIKSVLNQTYRDFEIIVIDDASTDNTSHIIESINDKRISFIRHKRNMGGSAARNTGIKAANGKYIAFLDSDDEWLPEKLEKQINFFQKAPKIVGVVYCGVDYIDNRTNKSIVKIIPNYRGNIYSFLLKCTTGPRTPSAIVKRECFEEVGFFDERLCSSQEPDLWIRISKNYEFEFINEILVKITRKHQQIKSDLIAQSVGKERFYLKHKNELTKRYKGGLCYTIGNAYSLNHNIIKGRTYFLKSIVYNPLYLKTYIRLIVSLFGSKFFIGIKNAKAKLMGRIQ